MSTTEVFTLEAQRNNLANYGDAEPVELKDISAIWYFKSQNSSGVKIRDKGGQEMRLTDNGVDQFKSLTDKINDKFIPAIDHLNDDHEYRVNPKLVSFKEETKEDDEYTAIIRLPNDHPLCLIDEEYGYTFDINETRKALSINGKAPTLHS